MRISLLQISLLQCFKTITKIWLMRFYGLFILLVQSAVFGRVVLFLQFFIHSFHVNCCNLNSQWDDSNEALIILEP